MTVEYSVLPDAGVLMRSRSSLRNVPDLNGDRVPSSAGCDERALSSYGYVEGVSVSAEGAPSQHAFVNTTRVDQQVRHYDAAALVLRWCRRVTAVAAPAATRIEPNTRPMISTVEVPVGAETLNDPRSGRSVSAEESPT